MELRFELLVFGLQLLVLVLGLIELVLELLQLRFVVADQTAGLLIFTKDPAGGQALQVRASVAIRTDKS